MTIDMHISMRRVTLLALLCCGVITAARAQTLAIGDAADFSRERMLAQWQAETAGTNLAAGRPVLYAPSPDYHLTTKGGTDGADLTDGRLAQNPELDQRIWWQPEAVGWGSAGTKKIIIDFGEAAVVSHVVWRVVAGSHLRDFYGPKSVRIYGSLDGDTAYLVGERYRWAEDFARPDAYRIPNIGPPSTGEDVYVYPLRVDVQDYRLRYLILEFEQDSVWFCTDELAVIAGEGEGQELQALQPVQVQTKDVWFTFDDETLPVSPAVQMPIWFRQTDLRPNGAALPVTYEFELPAGVRMHAPDLIYQVQQSENRVVVTSGRGGNTTEIGPFFLSPDAGFQGDAPLRFRAVGRDADPQPWHTVTLTPVSFPEPFALKYLTTSIGWMVDGQRMMWPDFATNYSRLGFNTIPAFPRAWEPTTRDEGLSTAALEQSPDPASLTAAGRQIAELRAQGFKTAYMESPLHVVNWMYPEGAAEYRCEGPITGIESFCPSYRGAYFQQELERLRRCYLLMGGADYIIWDLELLGSSQWKSPACSRCRDARDAAGMAGDDWIPFLRAQSTDMLRQMNAAVTSAKPEQWAAPAIGMYSVDSTHLYSGLLTYPVDDLFDFQNPSLYAGDYPERIHATIRQARANADTNNIIPWLSTKTGGRVTPTNARIIVWEALVNGAVGLTYFTFSDMTPRHYHAIATALSQIAPVEETIYYGSPAWQEFTVTDGDARLSATRRDKQAVLLLVNTGATEQTVAWRHDSGLTGTAVIPAGDAVLQAVDLP